MLCGTWLGGPESETICFGIEILKSALSPLYSPEVLELYRERTNSTIPEVKTRVAVRSRYSSVPIWEIEPSRLPGVASFGNGTQRRIFGVEPLSAMQDADKSCGFRYPRSCRVTIIAGISGRSDCSESIVSGSILHDRQQGLVLQDCRKAGPGRNGRPASNANQIRSHRRLIPISGNRRSRVATIARSQ